MTAETAKTGLYLHIPFCRKRCKFCYFRVYTDKTGGDVERYVSALSREAEGTLVVATDRDNVYCFGGK